MPRWAPRHDHHEPRRRDDRRSRSRTRTASGSPSSAWAGSASPTSTTLAAIPNARLVVVADLDPADAERGRAARARRPAPRLIRSTRSTTRRSRRSSSSPRRRPTRRSSRPRCGPARRSGARSRSPSTSAETDARRRRSGARPGIPVQMGFMRRFDPGYVRAKALIDAGELGRIEQFRAYSRDTYPPPVKFIRDSGGSFLDMTRPRLRPRAVPGGRGRGGVRLGQRT